MRPPRFTIAGLMLAVMAAAVLVAVFRAYSLWGIFALLPFTITALIARFGSSGHARRQALAVGAIGTLSFPFLSAIVVNRQLWGYFVSRPSLDQRIVQAVQIESITELETKFNQNGDVKVWGLPTRSLESYIAVHPQEGDYYVLEGRILRALNDRRALPAEPRQISSARLTSLYKAIENTDRLENGEMGYPNAKELRGIVVEAVVGDGRPLVFVGANGREVSNDHYPYYEFLFTSDSHDGPLRLLSFQRFYYDVAGIEGVEWPAFFPIFACLSMIPTVPLQGFLVLRGRRQAQ